MALKKKELARSLKDIINRLERTRSSALMIHDPSDVGLQRIDSDIEVAEEIEGMEAALLVAENRIDELTQVMGEEIDNLRSLLENIEEGLE